jgi:hypothetical protein
MGIWIYRYKRISSASTDEAYSTTFPLVQNSLNCEQVSPLFNSVLFLSNQCVKDILSMLSSSLSSILRQLLYDEQIHMPQLETCMELVQISLNNRPLLLATIPTTIALLPDVLLVAYLLPQLYLPVDEDIFLFSTAREIWSIWLQSAPRESVVQVRDQFQDKIRSLLKDTSVNIR